MKYETDLAKLNLLKEIIKPYKEFKIESNPNVWWIEDFLRYFSIILSRNQIMMNQEIATINLEISKFYRILQYFKITEKMKESQLIATEVKEIVNEFDILMNSIDKYSDDADLKYKEQLVKLNGMNETGFKVTDRKMEEIGGVGLVSGYRYPLWYRRCDGGNLCNESKKENTTVAK